MKRVILLVCLASGLLAENLDNSKNFGFSIAPLFWSSVGFSYFNHEKAYEIAVPAFAVANEAHIDIRYRKYLDGGIGGMFVGGFGRYTYMDGELKDEPMNARISKVGLGAEVGYRAFNLLGYKQLFWGVSLGAGAYLSNNNKRLRDFYLGDAPIILDVELFKIGYAF